MKKITEFIGIVILTSIFTHCEKPQIANKKVAEPPHPWLQGDTNQRVDKVAEHLRGNDVVMTEVKYRHLELYQAITTDNKDYALYQLEKIALTMKLGAERRPKRKPSYDWYFANALPPMQAAIETGDRPARLAAYQLFTASCSTCHAIEKVPFMPVARPWEYPPATVTHWATKEFKPKGGVGDERESPIPFG